MPGRQVPNRRTILSPERFHVLADFLLKGTFCPYLRASGGVLPDARLVLRRQLRSRVLRDFNHSLSFELGGQPCLHGVYCAAADLTSPDPPNPRTPLAGPDEDSLYRARCRAVADLFCACLCTRAKCVYSPRLCPYSFSFLVYI